MSTKSNPLQFGWTLISDTSYQLYSNKNCYVVLDEDHVLLRFAVQENEVEVLTSNWDLNYKVNVGFKTIKIINSPET